MAEKFCEYYLPSAGTKIFEARDHAKHLGEVGDAISGPQYDIGGGGRQRSKRIER